MAAAAPSTVDAPLQDFFPDLYQRPLAASVQCLDRLTLLTCMANLNKCTVQDLVPAIRARCQKVNRPIKLSELGRLLIEAHHEGLYLNIARSFGGNRHSIMLRWSHLEVRGEGQSHCDARCEGGSQAIMINRDGAWALAHAFAIDAKEAGSNEFDQSRGNEAKPLPRQLLQHCPACGTILSMKERAMEPCLQGTLHSFRIVNVEG